MSLRKIVIAFPFVGDDLGGSHISAAGLIAGLDRERFEPIVVLHKGGLVLEDYFKARGLPLTLAPEVAFISRGERRDRAGRMAAGLRFLRMTAKLARFLRDHKVDLVHTNDGQMHATWALAARLSGAKLLWHHRGDPRAWGVNVLAPLLANHIVTVSKFVEPAKPIVPVRHKTTVLHSPFDHPPALPDRDACRRHYVDELQLRADTRFVGYVGTLTERKRPLRFVEAVHAFLQHHPDFPIAGLIFGRSATNVPSLEGVVGKRADELGISDRIHLMGFRSPVAPCMGALDALLVTAVNEPFGRTLIEAMLLETPVIATNHGGNPEAIDDGATGYLVEADRPEAFVAPLERLLFDPNEWARISTAARQNALRKYGSRAHIDGISRLYEKLLGRRAKHHDRLDRMALPGNR
ncbi:glycosyltransferase family 4 protein [Sinorhizobium glycinis]|uniref:glycosyltransferase family 4 protein n=1 Tax=Sinorhizobium glycinis TaxID=1472378 RepID=UPI0007D8F3AB|nr:glycosyltransferase family 4 protein [Sinorhizobium glycinis]